MGKKNKNINPHKMDIYDKDSSSKNVWMPIDIQKRRSTFLAEITKELQPHIGDKE